MRLPVLIASVFYSIFLRMLDWLTRLYEAFNPHFHVQGSIADFDPSLIPGAHEGMDIVKRWVQDAIYDLHPGDLGFLTTILKLSRLLFTVDRAGALDCINQVLSTHPIIPWLTYPDPDGRYVVEDIVNLFDGNQQTCISSGSKFLMYVSFESMFICCTKLLAGT